MAENAVKVKLFRADDTQVKNLSTTLGKTKAEVTRTLIAEALKEGDYKLLGKMKRATRYKKFRKKQ